MRGLTTRNVRPCLQHSNFSFSAPPIRRTTFPPLQRPITCADAFLLFLPSVLTAALVVDYTGKERKRAEWEHQIAVAQEEADRLKQRQLESWSRIQRRSVSHGAWQQRRTLFTASRNVCFVDEEREEMMDPLLRRDEINTSNADIGSDVEPQIHTTTDEHIKKQERHGRLIATRLALELMLRLRQARSPLYKPQPTVDTTDKTFYQSMDYIVQELDKVLRLIQALEIQKVPWGIEMPAEYRSKQEEMAYRMLALSNQYRKADIHLPDYIMSYVQLVTDYKIGLPNWGYVEMMRALAYNQEQSRMARHVEDAIFDNHELLDSFTTSNILHHYGTVFDSFRFNQFLERITRADYHPRPRNPWHRLNVDDIDICVPRSKNGHILTGLIRTALACRQQTVAEAYASLFIDRDRVEKYSGIHKWFVLGSFLQVYGEWNSWKAGQKWLQTVLDWIGDLAAVDEHILGRVILRMLDFCVTCGQKNDYETIMSAVIAAHLQLPVVESEKKLKISHRMGAIRLDWSNRIKDSMDFDPLGRDSERVEKFKSMLDGRWSPQDESNKNALPHRRTNFRERGSIPYNPLAAQHQHFLEEATRQRQLLVNQGFKKLPSTSPRLMKFSVPDDQNPVRRESVDENMSSDSKPGDFSSPFFQGPVHAPFVQDANSDLDLIRLKEDLEATKKRLKEVEEQKATELAKLKRDLEAAHAELERVTVSTSTPLHEDNEVAKSSAAG